MNEIEDRSLRRRALKAGALVVVLALLFAVGYTGSLYLGNASPKVLTGNPLHLPEAVSQVPSFALPQPVNGERINILILGVDRRPGLVNYDRPFTAASVDDPGLTDTMAVLSINTRTRTATVVSIPRDLWLELPDASGGWTTGRINNAYYLGAVQDLPGGGPAAAMAAIKHNFGIPIDHYLLLDFSGFMDVIDALGGIDLKVPNTLTATVLPKANDGGYEYTFFAGEQHLNGELALAYARFRFDAEGDFGRIGRQQQVALAVRRQALSLGLIGHALPLFNKYHNAFDSDITAYQVPGYALLASQINSDAIQTRSLGEAGATTAVVLPSGADVLIPNPDAMAQIIDESFNDPALGSVAVERLREARNLGENDLSPATRRALPLSGAR